MTGFFSTIISWTILPVLETVKVTLPARTVCAFGLTNISPSFTSSFPAAITGVVPEGAAGADALDDELLVPPFPFAIRAIVSAVTPMTSARIEKISVNPLASDNRSVRSCRSRSSLWSSSSSSSMGFCSCSFTPSLEVGIPAPSVAT